jgi:hypothetical protein
MNQKRRENRQSVTIVGETKAQPAQIVSGSPQPIDIPISFDAWWIQTQSKHKLKPELREAVLKHFEARGFMDYKKFDLGLRDFGFRT